MVLTVNKQKSWAIGGEQKWTVWLHKYDPLLILPEKAPLFQAGKISTVEQGCDVVGLEANQQEASFKQKAPV